VRLIAIVIVGLLAIATLGGCAATAPPTPGDTSGWTLHVHIADGRVSPTGESVEVRRGDTVSLIVSADVAGELHVHSKPEQHIEFEAGSTTHELTFDVPGVVEIEDHASDTVIAQIEVK
jgi:plastocyanin